MDGRNAARRRLAAAVVVTVVMPAAVVGTGAGLQLSGSTTDPAAIARRYAPILALATGEQFRPLGRDGYVSLTRLNFIRLFLVRGFAVRLKDELWNQHPSVATLPHENASCPAGFNDCHFYLKVIGAKPSRGPAAYALLQQQLLHAGDPLTVYWHYDSGDTTMQYWFFYVFNNFLNRHEGDWEQITLQLGVGGSAPVAVGFSSHGSGEAKLWSQIQDGAGREGDHVVVYVARGSHANYFDTQPHALNQKCPRWVHPCYEVNDGAGARLDPDGYSLVPIDWQAYVGDYGPVNYVHLPRYGRKITVRDPPARRNDEWLDPACWIKDAKPASDLTRVQQEQLKQTLGTCAP